MGVRDIMQEQIQVTILCITYNHGPYIRNTLEHFVNQRVNFSYEILIHDDASTDDTADIIREYAEKYPNMFVPILQTENQYSQAVPILARLYPKCRGKYVAICEGDDYWPDLDKLQKQFDFLESHPDYSGVAGVTEFFDDDGNTTRPPMPAAHYAGKDATEWAFLNAAGGNIASNTLMVRASVVQSPSFVRANEESPRVGDILLMLKIFEDGKLYVMPDVLQHHKDQSRENASNYNSIFNLKQKFTHCVDVLNAITNNFEKPHNLSKWFERNLLHAYIQACRAGEKQEFMEIYQQAPAQYQVSLKWLWLKNLPSRAVGKIKRSLKG